MVMPAIKSSMRIQIGNNPKNVNIQASIMPITIYTTPGTGKCCDIDRNNRPINVNSMMTAPIKYLDVLDFKPNVGYSEVMDSAISPESVEILIL